MEPMLQIAQLKICFDSRTVLDIPELCFEKGKRYALIGANGSGKSTLLRIMAGIIGDYEGTVSVNTKSIGYMPQKPYAFGFSVMKNVRLAVSDKKTACENAKKALELVGLTHLRSSCGNRLSGGETQRMAAARIFAEAHELILLDEPTAAMDIEYSEKIAAALLEYAEETGCTMVFSTHSPREAAILAQEVILLDKGRIAEQGTAQQVLYDTRSEIGRSFLSHWRL